MHAAAKRAEMREIETWNMGLLNAVLACDGMVPAFHTKAQTSMEWVFPQALDECKNIAELLAVAADELLSAGFILEWRPHSIFVNWLPNPFSQRRVVLAAGAAAVVVASSPSPTPPPPPPPPPPQPPCLPFAFPPPVSGGMIGGGGDGVGGSGSGGGRSLTPFSFASCVSTLPASSSSSSSYY